MPSFAAALNSTNVRNSAFIAWNRLAFRVATLVSPSSAIERAARLFTTPPRYPHTPAEIEALRAGRGFVASVGFHRIAGWRFGEPGHPAIVFSHGWGGRGAQFRSFIAPLVARGFQVILFDHEGHGHSEGSQASLIHFVKGVEAVVAQLDAEAVEIAAFAGHSLGAAAIAAYLNSTSIATRALLLAPPTSIERYSYSFARHFGISEKIRRAMQDLFEKRFGRRWHEFELPHSVANVKASALVIHDDDDREVPPASGAGLARAWPGARLVRTRGLGHRSILRTPAVIDAAVEFLATEDT